MTNEQINKMATEALGIEWCPSWTDEFKRMHADYCNDLNAAQRLVEYAVQNGRRERLRDYGHALVCASPYEQFFLDEILLLPAKTITLACLAALGKITVEGAKEKFMNAVYLWIGFLVFWFVIMATTLAAAVYLYRYLKTKIRINKGFDADNYWDINLWKYTVVTSSNFTYLLRWMRENSGFGKKHPNSKEKITRAKYCGLLVVVGYRQFLGVCIVNRAALMKWVRGNDPLTEEQQAAWDAIKNEHIRLLELEGNI